MNIEDWTRAKTTYEYFWGVEVNVVNFLMEDCHKAQIFKYPFWKEFYAVKNFPMIDIDWWQ